MAINPAVFGYHRRPSADECLDQVPVDTVSGHDRPNRHHLGVRDQAMSEMARQASELSSV